MKTKQIIMSAFILSAALMPAQNDNKTTTVRMKKTVIVNGVEKTTDTTFTTTDASAIKIDGAKVNVEELKDTDGKTRKIIMINDEKNESGAEGKTLSKTIDIESGSGHEGANDMVIITNGEKMTPEEEAKLMQVKKEMAQLFKINNEGAEGMPTPKEGQQLMIKKVHCGASKSEIDSVKEITTIIIVKKVNIVNPSEEELRQIGKQTGISENKLAIDNIKFYPNPNNGKFNLAFSLAKKGSVDISIFNIEGKTIYNEKLPNFSGNYNKEIDISQHPKGNYFIKIAQGSGSEVKKIVID